MTFGVLALIVLAGLAGPLLSSGRRALVPVVVGELVAGVVIGTSGFRWLDPNEPTTAFLAQVGFVMLMFVAGMHVPLRQPGLASGVRRGGLAAVVAGLLAPLGGIAVGVESVPDPSGSGTCSADSATAASATGSSTTAGVSCSACGDTGRDVPVPRCSTCRPGRVARRRGRRSRGARSRAGRVRLSVCASLSRRGNR